VPFDPDKPITTREQALAVIAEYDAQHPRHTPATPPAPTQTIPAPTLPNLTEEQQANVDAARAAVQARKDREQVVDEARELLRIRLPERGYPADFADDVPPEEVLHLAGIEAKPMTARQAQQAREQAAQAADPGGYAQTQAEQSLADRWWGMSTGERQAACSEIGVDYTTANTHMLDQMRRRFP
jgi:hypothetical protein